MSLGLALFRFPLGRHKHQIIISALLLSYVSANIQYFDKGILTAIIQPICAILCFRLIFRIHFVHSAIMIVCSYAINILAEFGITFLISFFELDETVRNLQSNDILVTGLLIIVFNVVGCWILTRYRWGFSFISSRTKHQFVYQGSNKKIVLHIILCLALITGSSTIIYFFEEYIILKNALLVVSWVTLLKLAYQKDITE